MLNEREKEFVRYWEQHRQREKKLIQQLLIGLPIGFLFAVPILISVFSGKFWYQRFEMAANTKLSPVIMIIAIVCIAVFVAVFYKRHQWEMKDQQYQELKARENNPNEPGTNAATGNK